MQRYTLTPSADMSADEIADLEEIQRLMKEAQGGTAAEGDTALPVMEEEPAAPATASPEVAEPIKPEAAAPAAIEPTPEPVKPAADDDPNSDTYKHKYETLRGMHRAEERRIKEESARTIAELQAQIEAAKTQAKPAETVTTQDTGPSDDEIMAQLVQNLGDEGAAQAILKASDVRARRMVKEAIAELESGKIAPLVQTIQSQREREMQRAQTDYQAQLLDPKTGMPNIYELAESPEFLARLDELVPDGVALMGQHHRSGNAAGVIKLARLVTKSLEPQTTPAPTVKAKSADEQLQETMAAQAQARTKPASSVARETPKHYTEAEMDRISRAIDSGELSVADSEKWMRERRNAYAENRVH